MLHGALKLSGQVLRSTVLDLLFVLDGLGVLKVEKEFLRDRLLDMCTGDELLVSNCKSTTHFVPSENNKAETSDKLFQIYKNLLCH